MKTVEKIIQGISKIVTFFIDKLYFYHWWKYFIIFAFWGLIRGIFNITVPFLDYILVKILFFGLITVSIFMFLAFIEAILKSLLKFYKEDKITELIGGIIVFTFLISFMIFNLIDYLYS